MRTRHDSVSTKNIYKFPKRQTQRAFSDLNSFGNDSERKPQMNETINVNRNKLPPLSAMGTYEPAPKIDASTLKGPQRAASALGGNNTSPTNTGDPFYKQMKGMEAEREVPMTATPRTQASNGVHDKKLVAKNPKSGLKMTSTEKEVLEHIHNMRLK